MPSCWDIVYVCGGQGSFDKWKKEVIYLHLWSKSSASLGRPLKRLQRSCYAPLTNQIMKSPRNCNLCLTFSMVKISLVPRTAICSSLAETMATRYLFLNLTIADLVSPLDTLRLLSPLLLSAAKVATRSDCVLGHLNIQSQGSIQDNRQWEIQQDERVLPLLLAHWFVLFVKLLNRRLVKSRWSVIGHQEKHVPRNVPSTWPMAWP